MALCNAGCGISGQHSHLGNLLNKLRCGRAAVPAAAFAAAWESGIPARMRWIGQAAAFAVDVACSNTDRWDWLRPVRWTGMPELPQGTSVKGSWVARRPDGSANRQKVDYFVGAGGPVPLTPGYVPYIVTTRSPRDSLHSRQ